MKFSRTKSQWVKLCLGWAAALSWMVVIFSLSAQTAGDSSALSGGLLQKLLQVFPFPISEFLLRKFAHFSEFALLGILFYLALLATALVPKPWLALLLTALYAVSDEVHQLFVPGRACQFRDMCIDTSGALLGIAICMGIYALYRHRTMKK